MKLDVRDLKQRLAPLVNHLHKGWAQWVRLLPKLPDLSWSFFVFEKDTWLFYEPHRLPAFTHSGDVKQLDKTGLWVRVAPWKNTFHHDLKIAFTQASKRRELIPFQIEPLLPFPIDQAQLSHMAMEGETSVWVCAIQKRDIETIEEQSVKEGLRPDALVSPLFALMKGHQHLCKDVQDPVLYTQQEADRLVFVLVDHQKIWGLRHVVLAGRQLDLAALELEARRTLVFLQAPETAKRLWVGPVEEIFTLYDTLEGQGKENQETFVLMGAKAFVESPARYEGLISSKHVAVATKVLPWVRGWTWASAALLGALCLHTGLDHLAENRSQRAFAEKIIEEAHAQEIELPLLENFPTLESWTQETQQFIQNKLSPYPLQADLPSPRDSLGWLADILIGCGNAHITSFEYKSESFPDSKHIAARYRVKVDLEIEAQDPAVAESIQQKLLKAYDWIERPSSLVWKAQKDRYQVSFYLRDKTRYVQK